MHFYQLSLTLNLLITEPFMKQWSHQISEICEQKSWSSRTFSAKQELPGNCESCRVQNSAPQRMVLRQAAGTFPGSQLAIQRPKWGTPDLLSQNSQRRVQGPVFLTRSPTKVGKELVQSFLISLHASLRFHFPLELRQRVSPGPADTSAHYSAVLMPLSDQTPLMAVLIAASAL